MPTPMELLPVGIIVAVVELLKLYGIKDTTEIKMLVFIFAVILSGMYYLNKGWYDVVTGILLYIAGPTGIYQYIVKPLKQVLYDKKKK